MLSFLLQIEISKYDNVIGSPWEALKKWNIEIEAFKANMQKLVLRNVKIFGVQIEASANNLFFRSKEGAPQE